MDIEYATILWFVYVCPIERDLFIDVSLIFEGFLHQQSGDFFDGAEVDTNRFPSGWMTRRTAWNAMPSWRVDRVFMVKWTSQRICRKICHPIEHLGRPSVLQRLGRCWFEIYLSLFIGTSSARGRHFRKPFCSIEFHSGGQVKGGRCQQASTYKTSPGSAMESAGGSCLKSPDGLHHWKLASGYSFFDFHTVLDGQFYLNESG